MRGIIHTYVVVMSYRFTKQHQHFSCHIMTCHIRLLITITSYVTMILICRCHINSIKVS